MMVIGTGRISFMVAPDWATLHPPCTFIPRAIIMVLITGSLPLLR